MMEEQVELKYRDEDGLCSHCRQDPAIFWGREVCNHYHFPESCAVCEMLANHRRQQHNIVLGIIRKQQKLEKVE